MTSAHVCQPWSFPVHERYVLPTQGDTRIDSTSGVTHLEGNPLLTPILTNAGTVVYSL